MQALLRAFLIVEILTSFGYAECSYFRVSTALLKCGVVDSKLLDTRSDYETSAEVPELGEPERQALVKVSCDCSYSLMGSDPRCDMEQSMEKSAIVGADEPAAFCRRGRTLCNTVCAPRLP